ncbi:MAG: hypothetical protein Ta2A_12970 [Treponemataceae bacterium]|nr:MAG: hypothetical protein Ta2A_12970 [Treponemataceae bacterium]
MKKTLTFEELMAGFAEIRESQRKTDEQLRETREQMRETDAKIAELAVESRKTDAKIAEFVAATKETDAEMRKTDEQLRETRAKLAAELAIERKKTEKQMRQTHAEVEKISKLFGGHERNTGAVTEEYFADALTKKMTFAGMKFDTIARNINLCKGKLQDEFDIVMYNGSSIALIEAKYKAHENDLTKLVTSKVQNFRTLCPHYENYKIYLGLASMAFYDELIEKAKGLGVGILKRHGKTIEFSTETVRAY